MQLNATEQDALAISKGVHMCVLVAYVVLTVYLEKIRAMSFGALMLLPFMAFGLADPIEAAVSGSPLAETARRALGGIGKAIFGFILSLALFVSSV